MNVDRCCESECCEHHYYAGLSIDMIEITTTRLESFVVHCPSQAKYIPLHIQTEIPPGAFQCKQPQLQPHDYAIHIVISIHSNCIVFEWVCDVCVCVRGVTLCSVVYMYRMSGLDCLSRQM